MTSTSGSETDTSGSTDLQPWWAARPKQAAPPRQTYINSECIREHDAARHAGVSLGCRLGGALTRRGPVACLPTTLCADKSPGSPGRFVMSEDFLRLGELRIGRKTQLDGQLELPKVGNVCW